ncbi:MAG: ribbon-helix-helix protein, CopG family [Acetobacteraceae bacterium]|nr:ribbon-helix-helix protein, CopG family [Acetobacteraceae bacterium]MBV8588503.1 ribbon-helix-helix protein, CopG family [Acetobacteraceae bacterium]
MKKPGALASALRSSGANVAATTSAPAPLPEAQTTPAVPVRRGTKAITVHFPEDVRRQLKAMAAEQGRSMEDMVAEALNLLFARYRKPELAPRKSGKVALSNCIHS